MLSVSWDKTGPQNVFTPPKKRKQQMQNQISCQEFLIQTYILLSLMCHLRKRERCEWKCAPHTSNISGGVSSTMLCNAGSTSCIISSMSWSSKMWPTWSKAWWQCLCQLWSPNDSAFWKVEIFFCSNEHNFELEIWTNKQISKDINNLGTLGQCELSSVVQMLWRQLGV